MSDWISVKDRLPEGEAHVNVSCDTDFGKLVTSLDFDGGDFMMHNEPLYCTSYYIEVTHWMPLPGPPKESSK